MDDDLARIVALAEGWAEDQSPPSTNQWMQGYVAGVKAAAGYVLQQIQR